MKNKLLIRIIIHSLFFFLIFNPFLINSQNLIRNSSFENKTDTKFSYAIADKTLANWNCIKFATISLFHPSDALYVDTCLFDSFEEAGFKLTTEARKTVVRPLDGTCYIKSNNFHRVLFTQKLSKEIFKDEVYIVQFYYQIRSLSNEYNKIKSAHFGVSFFNHDFDLKHIRRPLFAEKLSIKFKNYVFINAFDSLSKGNWVKFQSTIYSPHNLSDLYIGNHTDFKTSIIPRKGTYGGVRSKNQESFLFFVDKVKLVPLSSFLSESFIELKNISFSIPLHRVKTERDLSNSVYLKQLTKRLKKNQYNSITLSIPNVKDAKTNQQILPWVVNYFIKQGIKTEKIIINQEIKSNLEVSDGLSFKIPELKILIQ